MLEIERIVTSPDPDDDCYISQPINTIIIRMEGPDGNLIKEQIFTNDKGLVQEDELQVCKHGINICSDCNVEEKHIDVLV